MLFLVTLEKCGEKFTDVYHLLKGEKLYCAKVNLCFSGGKARERQ